MTGGDHMMNVLASLILVAFVGVTFMYYWQIKVQREHEQALVHKLVELLYSRTYSEWAQGQRTVARGMAEMQGTKPIREPSESYDSAVQGQADL